MPEANDDLSVFIRISHFQANGVCLGSTWTPWNVYHHSFVSPCLMGSPGLRAETGRAQAGRACIDGGDGQTEGLGSDLSLTGSEALADVHKLYDPWPPFL